MLINLLPGNWFIPTKLNQLVANNLRNQLPMQGLRGMLSLHIDHALSLSRWNCWVDYRDRQAHRSLFQPSDLRFPILMEPLPVPCVYRIGGSPALINQLAG